MNFEFPAVINLTENILERHPPDSKLAWPRKEIAR
jgi:hypothetical protein